MQKENLIKFCKNILIKLNMDSDKAHATSEILVEADMMGHSTHGVRLLPNYVSDIEKGIMNVSGNYKIISEKKSNITIDGKLLPGIWLTQEGLKIGIEKAKDYGVSTVTIGNSHHNGALAAYLKNIVDKGFVANLTIYGAQKYGINIDGNHSTVFNVVIMNTGINSPLNSSGNGINARGVTSHSNCLVSVEAFNGYNEVGASNVTQKGGNADGIAIKRGAHNFTLIDVHAHHNSDDGYDFWKAGNGAPISEDEITIRLFYLL